MSEDQQEVSGEMQWFRMWHDAIADEKLLSLTYEQRWLWWVILTLASQSPIRGSLYSSENMPYSVEGIARKAYVNPRLVVKAMQTFSEKPYLMLAKDENEAWVVVNWKKRQPEREDSTNAERQARHRQKKHEESNALRNANITPPDTETDSDTDNRNKNKDKKPDTYDTEFEELWSMYPHPPVDDKTRARNNYRSLRKAVERDRIFKAVQNYAAHRTGEDPVFNKKAANFLGRDATWQEYENPVVRQQQPRTSSGVYSELN